jgi:hypothetical protein
MTIINFVFDKIDNGIPIDNIIPDKIQYKETRSNFAPWISEEYQIQDIIKYNNEIESDYDINFITTTDLINKNYTGNKNFYIVRIPNELFFSMWPILYVPAEIVTEINNGNVTLIIADFFGCPTIVPNLITEELTARNLKEHLFLNKIYNMDCVKLWVGYEKSENWSNAVNKEFSSKYLPTQWHLDGEPTFDSVPQVLGVNIYEKSIIPKLTKIKINPIDEYVTHKNKSHTFLYMNRSPRFHRYITFKIIEQLGLLKHAMYSSMAYNMNDTNIGLGDYNEYIKGLDELKTSNNPKLNMLYEYITHNPDTPDQELPNDTDFRKADLSIKTDISLENLKNTYFSVITETGSLSEKTFKMLFYGHPFILVGDCYSLAFLKQLGYKTFDCIFDESYDQITSIEKYICIAEQIQYFCTDEGKQKFIDKMPEIEEVLRYNRNLFLTKDHYEFWAKL